MTEEEKVGFVIRGVKESLLAGLVSNQPKTVAEFAQEALTIERTFDARTRQFNRPLQGCSISPCATTITDDWREIIREVVREELRRLLTPSLHPQAATVMDVVREEVQHALGTLSAMTGNEAQAMTYAAAVR